MEELKIIKDNYDERMDARIISNPSFKDQFQKAFKTLSEPVKWNFYNDGSFEIIGSIKNVGNEIILPIARFSIDNGFLNITTAKSSFSRIKDFIAGIDKPARFAEFEDIKGADAPIINTVESTCSMFTDEGIELAHVEFVDNYAISDDTAIAHDEDIVKITKSRLPESVEVPEDMFYTFPFSHDAIYSERSVKYRILPDLAIVYADKCTDGRINAASLNREQYPTATKNPELIETNEIPFSNKEYYRSLYKTDDQDELNRKVGLDFLHRIKESSRTKEINPKVYESIRKRMSEHLGIYYVAPGDDPAIVSRQVV